MKDGSVMAHKDLGGKQSDSDMVPQPAEFNRVQSEGKRVHAPLSYGGRVTVQESSNVVANSGCFLHFTSHVELVVGTDW